MSNLLYRFRFDPTKLDWVIVTVACVVWFTVVLCAIASVVSHKHQFTRQQRNKWILLITLLPGLGLLMYLPASLQRAGPDVLRATDKKKSPKRNDGTPPTTVSA